MDARWTGRRWALLGTGDFDTWSADVFQWACGEGPVAMVSVNQIENGIAEVERFRAMGVASLARAGIEARPVPLLSRQDADSDEALAALDDIAAVYVQGGGPRSGVDALRNSRFWRVLSERPISYVGSSGGVMMLGCCFPDLRLDRDDPRRWSPGLGLSDVALVPHWDQLDAMEEGLQAAYLQRSCHSKVLGIETATGVTGDGRDWRVVGTRRVHTWQGNESAVWKPGDTFRFRLFS